MATWARTNLQRPKRQVTASALRAPVLCHIRSLSGFTQVPVMSANVGDIRVEESDAAGAFAQQRPLAMAPRNVSKLDLESIYRDAMHYW